RRPPRPQRPRRRGPPGGAPAGRWPAGGSSPCARFHSGTVWRARDGWVPGGVSSSEADQMVRNYLWRLIPMIRRLILTAALLAAPAATVAQQVATAAAPTPQDSAKAKKAAPKKNAMKKKAANTP